MLIETSILITALTVAPADRLAMADRLFNRGEYAAAKSEYAALAGEKELPTEEIAYRKLCCAFQLGEKPEVRKDGEVFLRTFPASSNAGEVRYLRAMSAEGEERVRELRSLDAPSVSAARRASALCELGRITGDITAYERAMKADPGGRLFAYAKYYHAAALSASGNAADRRKAIEEFIDVAFGDDRTIGADALYSAACLTFSEKRYGEAVSLAKRYLKKFPDDRAKAGRLRSIAAISEYNSGKYSSALELCGEAEGEEFDMIRALATHRFGDAAKGEELAKKYLEHHPSGPHRKEMETLIALGAFSAAEKKGDDRAMLEASRRVAALSGAAGDRLRYAWALDRGGDAAAAEKEYEAVAAAFPKSAEAADALYRRGLSLVRREQWSAAELSLAEALSSPALAADRRGLASYWRGVACAQLGHTVKAEAFLKEALAAKLPPDEEREARLVLADFDYAAGRTEAAIAAYGSLVRSGAVERMNAAKTLAIGRLLGPEPAKLCAEALVRSASAEWRQAGYALLGDCEERLGNAAAAAAARVKALAENCTTESAASAALKLGEYEAAAGSPEEAEKHLALAIRLNRNDGDARARAYLGLAKCALSRDNSEEVRKYATVVTTLFEKSPSAAEAGELLRKASK